MIRDDIEKVFLSEKKLQTIVKDIGAKISRDYAGQEIVLVGILKGAVVFTADLARCIDLPLSLDFMRVSSYGSGSSSSGDVRILKDLERSIEGKNVVIVEDIIDTGITLFHLLHKLQERHPASLRLCTLLNKPERRKVDVDVDYIGCETPDAFLVGYGMDYAEKYRNLPFVGVLKKEIYQ